MSCFTTAHEHFRVEDCSNSAVYMVLVQHAQSHVTAGRPLRLFVTCWCSSIPTASGVDQTNHALAGGPHTRNHPAECPGKMCVLWLCTWLIRAMTGVHSSISIHYTVIVRATCRMLAWYVFLPPHPSPLLSLPPLLPLCVFLCCSLCSCHCNHTPSIPTFPCPLSALKSPDPP